MGSDVLELVETKPGPTASDATGRDDVGGHQNTKQYLHRGDPDRFLES